MSAFLCGKDHIDLLVSHCADNWFHDGKVITLRDTPRTEVGRILIAENIASLRHRYADDWWATDDKWYDDYIHTPVTEPVSPEQIIKACHCLSYQSCEHDGWARSEAHRIVTATREHYVREILNNVPDLQWEWTRSARV